MRFPAILVAVAALLAGSAFAQRPGFNYDESKVPAYELPDPLAFDNGEPVRSAADWTNRRRAEILELFEEHVYGRSPARPERMRFELLEQDDNALGGKARRKQVAVYFTAGKQDPRMELLLYLPSPERPGPYRSFWRRTSAATTRFIATRPSVFRQAGCAPRAPG